MRGDVRWCDVAKTAIMKTKSQLHTTARHRLGIICKFKELEWLMESKARRRISRWKTISKTDWKVTRTAKLSIQQGGLLRSSTPLNISVLKWGECEVCEVGRAGKGTSD